MYEDLYWVNSLNMPNYITNNWLKNKNYTYKINMLKRHPLQYDKVRRQSLVFKKIIFAGVDLSEPFARYR